MSKKFYVVRKGRNTGIFNTWNECKKQVDGFSGAEYKSFTSHSDAKIYLSGSTSDFEDFDENMLIAYVDGSYEH
ncbi:MAG: RNase H1/viroplasmin domain-containing protein, partial [Clostridioides sp.]|nr:RNase H1/viroplasmin domain-containing protein [Clostridioides sp.]